MAQHAKNAQIVQMSIYVNPGGDKMRKRHKRHKWRKRRKNSAKMSIDVYRVLIKYANEQVSINIIPVDDELRKRDILRKMRKMHKWWKLHKWRKWASMSTQ